MLLSHYLKHATPEQALQLYAGNPRNAKPQRITTQAELDAFILANKDQHIYFNTSLMAEAKSGRGKSEDALFVPAIFADFDCAGGKHQGDRPTKKQVANFLKSGEVPLPSYVIDTGGGLHAYWLVRENDPAKVAPVLESFNDFIQQWSKANNWKYERLKDLARVLRVPGSINHKYDNKPIVSEILAKPENVYSLSAFPQIVKDAKCPEFEPIVDDSRKLSNAMDACRKVPPEWGEDGSGYLLRMCRQFVRHGLNVHTCVNGVRTILSTLEDYPTKWTDEQISARYNDALQKSTLGEAVREVLPVNEYELAKYIAKKTENSMFYLEKWGKWVFWTGQKFEVGSMKPLLDLITDTSLALVGEREDKEWIRFLAKYQTRKGVDDIEKLMRHLLCVQPIQFDSNQQNFYCESGCLVLGPTGDVTLKPHSPQDFNMKLSKLKYDPSAKCPRWMAFLAETFVDSDGNFDENLAKYMQMVIGYCLTGRVDIQHLWVLYGDGLNGKGAFTRTIMALLGDYATSIDQETFTGQGQSFGTTRLFGARAAFASETDHDCRLNEHRVKNLTGGDRITTRDLYQSFWDFDPTHKLFLSTNYIPTIRGSDNGIWRRVKIVPFNARITEQDASMEPAFMQELSGILNWAIEGYSRLQMFGLDEPAIVTNAGKQYREECDIVRQFIDDECELDPQATISNHDLFARLTQYCRSTGQYCPSTKKATKDFERHGVVTKRQNKERFKVGIKFKTFLP